MSCISLPDIPFCLLYGAVLPRVYDGEFIIAVVCIEKKMMDIGQFRPPTRYVYTVICTNGHCPVIWLYCD
jgi:hypothetical protein